jgi:hypothetical protein
LTRPNPAWNQFVNKKIQTEYGKTDDEELINVINILRSKFPKLRYRRDWFIMFDRLTGAYMKHAEVVTYNDAHLYKFLRPDIIVEKPGAFCLIEIDGPIHDKKTQVTINKVEVYENAGIRYKIANKADLKQEGIDLITYLEVFLKEFS